MVVAGLPNTGKSSLVNVLTKAAPKVSEYPFTTWAPVPGMMNFQDIQIQLIDTPPLNRTHMESELFDLIRGADLILLTADIRDDAIEQLEEAIAMLGERRIAPVEQENKRPQDPRLTLKPLITAVTKTDTPELEEDFEALEELLEGEWTLIPVSVSADDKLERLKETIFQRLSIMRIYSKPPGKKPEMNSPFVLKKGSTVADFASMVHKDFKKILKIARLWSGERAGQMAGRDHVLKDGDIVELQT